MAELLKPPLLDETGQIMNEKLDNHTTQLEKGFQKLADILQNTEAVQNAKAEIQAEGAAQVENVQAAAEQITEKVAQIDQNTENISQLSEQIIITPILVDGEYVKKDGTIAGYSTWHRTSIIHFK